MIDTLFLCGGLSGIIAELCLHPFDTIRARIQTKSSLYRGLWHGLRTVVRTEGPRALYRGFPAVLLFSTPGHAVYYSAYDAAKAKLPTWCPGWISRHDDPDSKCPSFQLTLAAGLLADMAAELLWTPQDVIKQRLQVHSSSVATLCCGDCSGGVRSAGVDKYRTLLDSVRAIHAQNGIRTFFTGYWIGVLTMESPLYFTAYEQLTHGFSRLLKCDRHHLSLGGCAASSFMANAIAVTVNAPLDVLRTRLQVQGSVADMPHYNGPWHAFRKILRTEGSVAFYRGVPARVMYNAPNAMVAMVAFEFLKRVMGISAPTSAEDFFD